MMIEKNTTYSHKVSALATTAAFSHYLLGLEFHRISHLNLTLYKMVQMLTVIYLYHLIIYYMLQM